MYNIIFISRFFLSATAIFRFIEMKTYQVQAEAYLHFDILWDQLYKRVEYSSKRQKLLAE